MMRRRTDIPPESIRGSSRSAVALEYVSKVAAIGAIVLLVLVVVAIDRGRVVQASAKGIVGDFHTANDFFDQRADFTAPTTAREQLQTLSGVLTELNAATAEDVDMLAATIPDVQRLLAAGRGDVLIAHELDEVAATLRNAGGSLKKIAVEADGTVSAVDREVRRANHLVDELNAVLAEIDRKLALLPTVPADAASEGQVPVPERGGN